VTELRTQYFQTPAGKAESEQRSLGELIQNKIDWFTSVTSKIQEYFDNWTVQNVSEVVVAIHILLKSVH